VTNIQGGAALPVAVSTQAPIGDQAIPVAVVSDGRPTQGADTTPVYVVSAAELAAGAFVLEGGDPRPVVAVADGRPVLGQRPIPVYVVSGSLNPTPAWSPASLANLALWLDASQITGLANADPVTTWNDLSGAGNNATGAGATRPTYRTNVLNGLPTVRFSGSFLDLAGAGLNLVRNVAGFTLIAVTNPAASATQQRVLYASAASSGSTRAFLFRISTTQFQTGGRRLDADSFASISNTIPATQQFDVWIARYDYANTTVQLYQDAVTPVASSSSFQTAGNTQDAASGMIRIGADPAGGNGLSGDIAELFAVQRAVTPAEISQIIAYCTAKYALGPAIVTSALLAEYRFVVAGLDTGPNGFNATLGGGAAQQSYGIQLAADPDFVSFPAGAQIASQINHTLHVVFRVPTFASELVYVEGDGSSTEFVFINRNAGGTLTIRYRRTTATSYDVSTTLTAVMPVNTWGMLTLRRSGTALTADYNDRATTNTAVLGAQALPSRTVNRLNNGGGTPALSNPARPDVAYMATYSAALSNAEVSANYAAIKAYLALRGVSLP